MTDLDTTELDPTEQGLAAALDRLATAYVPVAGEPPAPAERPVRRRWLALAVAASLIALVAGIWAVAGRPTDPTTSTPPATSMPPETRPAVPDDPVAIIDPAVAPSQPTTAGQVDRFLRYSDAYERESLRAIRRAPAGAVQGLAVYLAPDVVPFRTSDTIAGRPTWRSVQESFDSVALGVDLDGGTLVVTTATDAEAEVRGWLERMLADPQIGDPAVSTWRAPDGFEALAGLLTVNELSYADGDADVTLQTMQFAGPVDAADWVVTQSPRAEVRTTDQVLNVVMVGGAGYQVWQPSPDVLVTVTGDEAPERWTGDLRLASMASTQPVPIIAGAGFGADETGLDERTLDRIVLGETRAGRFAYYERVDADGACSMWVTGWLGGGSSCSATPTVPAARWCGTSWTIGQGAYLYAFVIDSPEASFEFTADGSPADPTVVERGQAVDGTPFAAAWIADPDAASDGALQGTVTIDGTAC